MTCVHGKYLWIPTYVDTHMHIRMINGGSPVGNTCWMMVSKNSTLSSVSFHALLTSWEHSAAQCDWQLCKIFSIVISIVLLD